MAMKKKERARVNSIHLAMDVARSKGAIHVEDVLRDAKRIAKFLAKS